MSPCLWFSSEGKGFSRSFQMMSRTCSKPLHDVMAQSVGSGALKPEPVTLHRESQAWKGSGGFCTGVRLTRLTVRRKHCEKLSYKNCWTVCLWEQPAAAAERSSRFFHQPLWFLWKEEESYLMVRSKNSRDGLWRVNTDGSDGSQDPMIRTTDTRSRVQLRVKQLELYCIYLLRCSVSALSTLTC